MAGSNELNVNVSCLILVANTCINALSCFLLTLSGQIRGYYRYQFCGSGPFFRIRIHGSGFQNSDPDPVDPKKTGSGSNLDLFFMFSKINNCFMAFWYLILTSYDTSSKIKKIILTKLYFRQFYITRKLELLGSFLSKDSDPVFSRIRIWVTKKDGSNRIRIQIRIRNIAE